MKLFATLPALVVTAGCWACASSGSVPNTGVSVPDSGGIGLPSRDPRCAPIENYVAKWVEKLRLQDWKVVVVCKDVPGLENAWAISNVDSVRREIGTVVDPDAPDIELTVAHELVHAIMESVRKANSELVEEQEVRTLSELMLCREPLEHQ